MYGRALLHDRQFEAAEQVLQQATERFPVDPSAFFDLAGVAEQLKHFDVARTALIAYNGLVGDNADFAGRALKIGVLSLSLNDPQTAVAWLVRASAAAPDDLKTVSALADAQFKTGDREAAQAALKRGLELDPGNLQLRALARKIGV